MIVGSAIYLDGRRSASDAFGLDELERDAIKGHLRSKVERHSIDLFVVWFVLFLAGLFMLSENRGVF